MTLSQYFRLWAFITLVALWPFNARAESFKGGRDIAMFSMGALQTTLLGLVSFKALTDSSENARLAAQGYLPRDDVRVALFEKWRDLRRLPLAQGLKTTSQARLYADLSLYGSETDDLALQTQLAHTLRELEAPSLSLASDNIQIFAQFKTGYLLSSAKAYPALATTSVTNSLLQRSDWGTDGRFLDKGRHAYLELPLTVGFSRFLDLHVTPLMTASSIPQTYQGESTFDLLRLYATVHLRALSLQVGRDNVVWGVGRLGNMLLSGRARPFDMVRLRNDTPVILPGFLRHLGPTQYEAFITRLDSDQLFPKPFLVGSKSSFQVTPGLELGLGYLVQWGGKGAPTQSPAVYYGEVFTDAKAATNRAFVFDTRYRFEKFPLESYSELLFEDCCDSMPVNPRDVLNLVGFHFPNVDGEGKLDMTFEWARTSYITYRHGRFTDGMVYRGQPLGHVLGPDATGVYAQMRYMWSPRLWWSNTFSHELRGRTGAALSRNGDVPIANTYPNYETPEERHAWLTRIQLHTPTSGFARAITLSLEGGLEWLNSANYEAFRERTQALLGLSAQAHF